MPKRAILIAKTNKPVPTPQGVVQVPKDMTKIVELTTTLQEVLRYADEQKVDSIVVIFESEDPDIRRPHIVGN